VVSAIGVIAAWMLDGMCRVNGKNHSIFREKNRVNLLGGSKRDESQTVMNIKVVIAWTSPFHCNKVQSDISESIYKDMP
jgi:hypothetical protein